MFDGYNEFGKFIVLCGKVWNFFVFVVLYFFVCNDEEVVFWKLLLVGWGLDEICCGLRVIGRECVVWIVKVFLIVLVLWLMIWLLKMLSGLKLLSRWRLSCLVLIFLLFLIFFLILSRSLVLLLRLRRCLFCWWLVIWLCCLVSVVVDFWWWCCWDVVIVFVDKVCVYVLCCVFCCVEFVVFVWFDMVLLNFVLWVFVGVFWCGWVGCCCFFLWVDFCIVVLYDVFMEWVLVVDVF